MQHVYSVNYHFKHNNTQTPQQQKQQRHLKLCRMPRRFVCVPSCLNNTLSLTVNKYGEHEAHKA